MKNNILKGVILGCLLLAAGTSYSQDDERGVIFPESGGGFLIGPIGGINLVTYSSDAFPILNSEPGCFEAQNGSGIAPFAGISAELPLGSTMQNFILIEAIYDSKSSKFTSDNANRTDVPTKVGGVQGPGNITTDLTADLSYLILNGGYKYNFTEGPAPIGPGVALVASVGLKMATTLNKTVTVSAVTGSSTVTNSEEVTDAQSIRIALRGMFTYDIPLSADWIATPTVGYDFPVTKVDDSFRNWSASAAWAGIAVRYFLQ